MTKKELEEMKAWGEENSYLKAENRRLEEENKKLIEENSDLMQQIEDLKLENRELTHECIVNEHLFKKADEEVWRLRNN